MEGMRTAAQEVEQMEGEENTDGTETVTEDYYSEENNVVNITLWTEHNDLLAYYSRLELCHLIMSKLGEHEEN